MQTLYYVLQRLAFAAMILLCAIGLFFQLAELN